MCHTIAIDGPAAAGKGTIAKALAEKLGFHHLDTGLLYRAIGAAVLKGQNPILASKNLCLNMIDAKALRNSEIAIQASKVAKIPQVRQNLISFQRDFAKQKPGSVLDGRDIGTVILPDASLKFFITANIHVRAQRRFNELRQTSDKNIDFATILEIIKKRDAHDTKRDIAPLKAAEDAYILDSSDMSVDTAIATALEIVTLRLAI